MEHGERLHNLGEALEACKKYEEAVQVYRQVADMQIVRLVRTLNDLGASYLGCRTNNGIEAAIPILLSALDLAKGTTSPDDIQMIQIHIALGNAHLDKKTEEDYRLSREYYHQAMKLIDQKIGANKGLSTQKRYIIQRSICLNNIAEVDRADGKLDQALKGYEDALVGLETVGLSDSNKAALYIANMGELFLKQGDKIKAEEKFRKALELHLKHLGENHPSIAHSYLQLAQASEDKKEEEMLLEKALSIYKENEKWKAASEYHQETINALAELKKTSS